MQPEDTKPDNNQADDAQAATTPDNNQADDAQAATTPDNNQADDAQAATTPDNNQADDAQAADESKEGNIGLSYPEAKKYALEIAEKIGETEAKPIEQLIRIVRKCGLEFAQNMLEETEKVESEGGLKTHDLQRRRTKGGVYFFIAKSKMSHSLRRQIFSYFDITPNDEAKELGSINWEDRAEHIKQLQEDPGYIDSATITITGRPGKVYIEGHTVMTVIEQKNVKTQPYPKGVTPFESIETTTRFNVFLSTRHWHKVENYLKKPNDLLIVSGVVVFDAELDGISLLSTSVTTKLLEREKKTTKDVPEHLRKSKKKGKPAGKNAQPEKATKDENAEKAEKPKKDVKPKKDAKPASQTKLDLSKLPESVADKLQQLYSAADTLRQKVATLESDGKKSGLSMTRRLLEQTEKQISALEKQYDNS